MWPEELAALSDDQLVAAVARGDREAAAEFVRRNRNVLASRYRWRLRNQPTRIADTDDFLSTLARRVDRYVAEHRILASGAGRLFALIDKVADRASLELVRRSTRVHAREARGARPDWESVRSDEEDERGFHQLISDACLDDDARDILRYRLAGLTHDQIAGLIGITPKAVQKRFERTISKLRERAADTTPVSEKDSCTSTMRA